MIKIPSLIWNLRPQFMLFDTYHLKTMGLIERYHGVEAPVEQPAIKAGMAGFFNDVVYVHTFLS